MRVLVVEDEPLVRTIAVEALEEAGFEVLEAGSGAEALALIDEPVDLLLTDVIMPGPLDGWAVAEAFRKRCPELSVIYTSGYPLDDVPVADAAFLQKPYRVSHLIEVAEAKARAKGLSPAA